jgi:hypothetical protein
MLTDRQIKTLPTTGKPYRKRDKSSDPGLKGFGMQVSAAGSKTFFVEYTFKGERGHFFKLGSYPLTNLVDARQACRDTRRPIDRGIDPKVDLERRRIANKGSAQGAGTPETIGAAHRALTYEDLVRLYLGTVKNPTTRTEISRLFEKDAKPELREMRVTDIEPTDIRRVLDRASKRGAKRVPWMLHS